MLFPFPHSPLRSHLLLTRQAHTVPSHFSKYCHPERTDPRDQCQTPFLSLSLELQDSDNVQVNILLLDIRPDDLKGKISNVDLRCSFSSSPRKASPSLGWTCTKMKQRLASKTKSLPWQFQKHHRNQQAEKVTAVRIAPYLAWYDSVAGNIYCWLDSEKLSGNVYSVFKGK